MSAATAWTFFACPTGIAAKYSIVHLPCSQSDRDFKGSSPTEAGQPYYACSALLEAEVAVARQVPPTQVKAFSQSRGTRAKTDRIDAELIARFFSFHPEAGCSLPVEKATHSQSFNVKTSSATAADPISRTSGTRHRRNVRGHRHRV